MLSTFKNCGKGSFLNYNDYLVLKKYFVFQIKLLLNLHLFTFQI